MANDRLSQLPVEVVLTPTDQKARVSQEPVEVVVLPVGAKARTSQLVIEVIVQPNVDVHPGTATGTGSAYDAHPSIAVHAGVATGTGTAHNARGTVDVLATPLQVIYSLPVPALNASLVVPPLQVVYSIPVPTLVVGLVPTIVAPPLQVIYSIPIPSISHDIRATPLQVIYSIPIPTLLVDISGEGPPAADDPAVYKGQTGAIHVQIGDHSEVSVGPHPDEAILLGKGAKIITIEGAPDHWDDASIVGAFLPDAVYKGRSKAVHVRGPAVAPPGHDPIPACRCCAEVSPEHWFEGTFTYHEDSGGSSDGVSGTTLYSSNTNPAQLEPSTTYRCTWGMIIQPGDYAAAFWLANVHSTIGAVVVVEDGAGVGTVIGGSFEFTTNSGSPQQLIYAHSSVAGTHGSTAVINTSFTVDPADWEGGTLARGDCSQGTSGCSGLDPFDAALYFLWDLIPGGTLYATCGVNGGVSLNGVRLYDDCSYDFRCSLSTAHEGCIHLTCIDTFIASQDGFPGTGIGGYRYPGGCGEIGGPPNVLDTEFVGLVSASSLAGAYSTFVATIAGSVYLDACCGGSIFSVTISFVSGTTDPRFPPTGEGSRPLPAPGQSVINDTVIETPDGVRTDFTLRLASNVAVGGYLAGTLSATVDDVPATIIELSPVGGTLRFVTPPPLGSSIYAAYDRECACAECEDPDNPGFQLPAFTPGFMPTFRRQIGDPTTSLDGFICTLESAAMVLEWHTRGVVSVWGGELIPWCGKTEAQIGLTGTNLNNARLAWLHWDQILSVRSGQSWGDVLDCLAEGRAIILQGDYGELNLAERCQDNFEDNHAVSLYPYIVSDRILTGDPLCHDFHGVKASTLQRYAEALGRAVYGVTSPQKILFAVSRPWTP